MFATALVAVIAVLPLAICLPSNCDRTYTVVEGDTCDGISAAKNASTYQLAAVNSPIINADCSNLAIGQVICLGTTGSDCGTTYVVAPNDTCDAVSTRAGINNTMLYLNNPQLNSDCSNLYIGEVVCTLNQVRVPPAPLSMPTSSVSIAPGTVAAASHPTQAAAGDEDLPWCDDPNDDGEW